MSFTLTEGGLHLREEKGKQLEQGWPTCGALAA